MAVVVDLAERTVQEISIANPAIEAWSQQPFL
jgi:hypothetical protein